MFPSNPVTAGPTRTATEDFKDSEFCVATHQELVNLTHHIVIDRILDDDNHQSHPRNGEGQSEAHPWCQVSHPRSPFTKITTQLLSYKIARPVQASP
jgi:hypothetical protein